MSRRRKKTNDRKYSVTRFSKDGNPETNEVAAKHSFKAMLIYLFGMMILLAALLGSLFWFVETNPTTGKIEIALEGIEFKGPLVGVVGLALIAWIVFGRKITDTFVE